MFRKKWVIDWFFGFVLGDLFDYDKIEFVEFVIGILVMIKFYDNLKKLVMFEYFLLLMKMVLSYFWFSVCVFYVYVVK